MTLLFIQWLLLDAPATYLRYGKEVTLALYQYFSMSLLGRTLFDPWRHDAIAMDRLPIRYWFQAILSNTTSRTIGFVIRFVTILSGLSAIFIWNLGLFIFLIAWYTLPILLIISVLYGFKLLGASG